MAALQHKVPSWYGTTAKIERHGVTTSLGGLSARNAVSSSYLSRNRGSALPARAGVEAPRATPTIRCTQSQVDSSALEAAPVVPASPASPDPLLLVAPESLSYPSGFLAGRERGCQWCRELRGRAGFRQFGRLPADDPDVTGV